MSTVQVGDIGASIVIGLGEDISSATDLKIVIKRPTLSDVFLIKDPTSTSDTSVTYITEDGDLSASGTYEVQVYYEDLSWSGYSSIATFRVGARLYDVSESA